MIIEYPDAKHQGRNAMDTQHLRRILVVDDESAIVNAVQRELSIPPLGHYSYETEGYTDPVQALERARNVSFDAVICDYRMPGIDGLEFFKALREIQPDCARLVLSGQTDMDALIRMVNETHIYQFVPKPWHDYYLKSVLAQALDYAAAITENKRLAEQVRKLGIPIPDIAEDAIDQILIVDDDPGVLASLARVLTRHSRIDDLFSAIRSDVAHHGGPVLDEGRVSVQITPSARHALKIANEVTFACIIADYKMPEMNGIELLQKFGELQPACARLLISGAISQEALVHAVGSVHIFGFIRKPWQDFELKASIAQALVWRRMSIENETLAEMVKTARKI